MDTISDILQRVRLAGGVFVDGEFTAPWSVAGQVSPHLCTPFMDPPQALVAYHYVIEGRIEVRVGDLAPVQVRAGEAVMLPHNDPHVFGSGERVPAVSVKDLLPSDMKGVVKLRHGGGGALTRLICGCLCGNDQLRPLLANLPPVMVVPITQMPGGDWLCRTFSYAAQMLTDRSPGGRSAVARLSEVLFIETMRHYLAETQPEPSGWLAALRDPAIGRALALLHARLGDDWTAEALASEVNMSRSAFADRFTAVVGQPPMRYLTGWRMQLARQRLAETQASVAQIGYEVGYSSEAAFARAFRREHGAPPAAWRKRSA